MGSPHRVGPAVRSMLQCVRAAPARALVAPVWLVAGELAVLLQIVLGHCVRHSADRCAAQYHATSEQGPGPCIARTHYSLIALTQYSNALQITPKDIRNGEGAHDIRTAASTAPAIALATIKPALKSDA